jgi:MoxR-like ATPase
MSKIILIPSADGTVQTTNGAMFNKVAVREALVKLAHTNSELLEYDTETGKARRVKMEQVVTDIPNPQENKTSSEMKEPDPVLAFIHNEAISTKPKELIIKDLKWKYLIRSVMRGKNIMMTGPAGAGKSVTAKHVAKALNREFFYFNLGATQDPRATLIGNVHFNKETGTYFSESHFIKAIQTENAVILLDELSRAHPEAWNILMTVLDPNQKYVRLDEHQDAKTVAVAPGVSFIATANIGNEYTSTRSMDRALLDRFVILEMDVLTKEDEMELLSMIYPHLEAGSVHDIAEIAHTTRLEVVREMPKITSAISTRLTIEMAGLMADGFKLNEAAEVCIFPFFDNAGGVDSERTFIRQLVQKYIKSDASEVDDIFNLA